ncbi:hypothetical protein QBC41DRAFT_342694 [Cercophora samala]|uniref:MaoC-like domain-containing protein n=1 Tax=Cercophora samala TaxID=330535 RepID=A0AA40DG54_9PEZI|nr:hypothetical protein QBC41DRAFT_342694 [Cercophora samala]
MRSLRPLTHMRLRPPQHLTLTPHHHRPYSSSPPINTTSYLASAREKFTSQLPKLIPATLTPSKADQLTLALEDANPAFCQSHGEIEEKDPLPQGYHMVYFEPKLSSYKPMSDGTDPYHFPGEPFERRMWVGGEVTFEPAYWKHMLLLSDNGTKAECIETVNAKATEIKGDKVFVEVGREYFATTTTTTTTTAPPSQSESAQSESKVKVLSETRKLVFLRPWEKEEEGGKKEGADDGLVNEAAMQQQEERLGKRKKIKAPWTPLFSFPLAPSARFLSLFSVLTSNAHRIHLDGRYARVEEGYKDALVHGPLTLVLMLEGLTSYLYKRGKGDMRWTRKRVRSMSYRNLAPLFRGDEMRVCGALTKTKGEEEEEWVVWIEDFEGGLAVKGSATVVGR